MMHRLIVSAFAMIATASVAAAQHAHVMSPTAQIAAAVSALPEEFRADATVLGYTAGSTGLSHLRQGKGPFICLADDPKDERFHVACYHNSLEAFMARGRELRAGGVQGSAVDSARFAEINTGKLIMPKQPAALYSITTQPANVNHETGVITGGRPLYVIYVPFATSESTGLPKKPTQNMPWIMQPGSPKAHIMFSPTMN
jgi:hypothetical protein